MTHAPTTPEETEDDALVPSEFISAKEAARLLTLSRSRVYELMDEGVIPSARLGRRRVIPEARFRELLSELMAG
jgi:excisionase family DNA binding protein